MDILELLHPRGLEPKAKTKFIRHMGDKGLVERALEQGLLEEYQSYQRKKFFQACEFIVSFVGEGGSHARLYGVYRVTGSHPIGTIPKRLEGLIVVSPEQDLKYDLEEMSGFEDLKGRVVIDWGKGALSWHRWASPMEVIEVRPKGYVRPFPGYLDFILTFDQLSEMVAHPMANREWRTMLSAVAGVYLIVDHRTGRQYVGSAYGAEGIWGRWSEYARSGHGNNVMLRELLEPNCGYTRNLRFTVLRTLPKTLTDREVIGFENLYKEKLGSRAFGLNPN